jgi:hypothetical protein
MRSVGLVLRGGVAGCTAAAFSSDYTKAATTPARAVAERAVARRAVSGVGRAVRPSVKPTFSRVSGGTSNF